MFVACSLGLLPIIGQDFFPSTDAGIDEASLPGTFGTRIERTEELVAQVEGRIRRIIPAELVTVNSTIGIPGSTEPRVRPHEQRQAGMDAEILVQLAEHHWPTAMYVNELRTTLNRKSRGRRYTFRRWISSARC